VTIFRPWNHDHHRHQRKRPRKPDRQNAHIEHDKALGRVILALMKDDTELFKQFSDNESFRRWLTDTVFDLTYAQPGVASYH
jgi:hypothetical protein